MHDGEFEDPFSGDNGILKKAGDAKTQTEQAKEDENLKIAIAGSYGTDGKLNLKDLKDNLENQGINYDKNNTGFPLEVTVNGEKKKIDANGNIIESIQSLKMHLRRHMKNFRNCTVKKNRFYRNFAGFVWEFC